MDKIKDFLKKIKLPEKLKSKKVLIGAGVVVGLILIVYLLYSFVFIPNKYVDLLAEYSELNQKLYVSILDQNASGLSEYNANEMMQKLFDLSVEYKTDKKEGIESDFASLLGKYYMAYVMMGFYNTSDDNMGNYDNDLESLFNPSAMNTINFMGQSALIHCEREYKEFIDKYAIFRSYKAIDERVTTKISELQAIREKEESKPEEYDKINEVKSFVTSEMWNTMCDISWYISRGTSSTGGNIDIDLVVLQIEQAIPKLDEYNTYMNSLKGTKYQQIVYAWNKLYPEIKSQYVAIESAKPLMPRQSIYGFSLDLFEQYQEAFEDEQEKLEKDAIDTMELKDALSTINSFTISEAWNKMCDISWYISRGTSSTGDELDVEFVIKQMNDSKNTLEQYNSYITELDGQQYGMLKLTWNKFYTEYKKLLDILNTAKPLTPKQKVYGFSLDLLEQYQEAFEDELDEIKNNL